MEGVCFLHIGTHKTGTSSLQTLLLSNQLSLERNGILVPRSGRALPHSGHHNLAWESMGNSRFDPAFGAWREALGEIRSRNPPAVCISSEDFEYLYRSPRSLGALRQMLNSIGYEVTIVVYLRPQADYLESLYVELLKNGHHLTFRDYLEQIFQRGPNAPDNFWAGGFDYVELLDSFAAAFGKDRIVVRPYHAHRRTKYLLHDFISVIAPGRRIRGLSFNACRHRLNPSLSFAQVMKLMVANRGKSGNGDCAGSIPDGHFMNGRFDPLNLRDLTRIDARFRAGNRAMLEKYQVKIATMTSRRLLHELLCSAGLNRGSARRKRLLEELDAFNEPPQVALAVD